MPAPPPPPPPSPPPSQPALPAPTPLTRESKHYAHPGVPSQLFLNFNSFTPGDWGGVVPIVTATMYPLAGNLPVLLPPNPPVPVGGQVDFYILRGPNALLKQGWTAVNFAPLVIQAVDHAMTPLVTALQMPPLYPGDVVWIQAVYRGEDPGAVADQRPWMLPSVSVVTVVTVPGNPRPVVTGTPTFTPLLTMSPVQILLDRVLRQRKCILEARLTLPDPLASYPRDFITDPLLNGIQFLVTPAGGSLTPVPIQPIPLTQMGTQNLWVARMTLNVDDGSFTPVHPSPAPGWLVSAMYTGEDPVYNYVNPGLPVVSTGASSSVDTFSMPAQP